MASRCGCGDDPVIKIVTDQDGDKFLVVDDEMFPVSGGDGAAADCCAQYNPATRTITFGDGSTVVVPATGGGGTVDTNTFVTIVDNGDGTATATDTNGDTFDLLLGPLNAGGPDTFVTVVDNGDGTITLTGTDGNTHTIATGPHNTDFDTDTFVTFTTLPDGSVELTPADGGPATVIPPNPLQVCCGAFVFEVEAGDPANFITWLTSSPEFCAAVNNC